MSGWLVGISRIKAQWKCAMTTSGGECATRCGMQATPGSCATSWVTPLVSITLADHEYALNHLMLLYYTAYSPFYNSFFGSGIATITWSDVGGCRGSEGSLFQCSFTTPVKCNSSHFAGVRCFGKADGPQF